MPFQVVDPPAWDKGINEVSPAIMLEDHEMVNCLNFEYDKLGTNLIPRHGSQVLVSVGIAEPGQITSIFGGYITKNRTSSQIVFTFGNHIYRQKASDPTTFESIGDALGLSSVKWQWVQMNDTAIGVNRDVSGSPNPVKVPTTGNAAALGGSPPKGAYIEVWNGRCFIVSASLPNRVYFSALGNSEDYTTVGSAGSGFIEVGYDDGEYITGIKAHMERLFVFKRSRIYQIITANPNTDPNLWRLELFTSQGGCISIYTAKALGNDLLFWSHDGLVSMNAVNQWGDFRRALISKKMQLNVDQSTDAAWAAVRPDRGQYCLTVPRHTDPFNPVQDRFDLMNVFDYSPSGEPRFVNWQFYHNQRNDATDPSWQASYLYSGDVAYQNGFPVLVFGVASTIGTDGNPLQTRLWQLSDGATRDEVVKQNDGTYNYDGSSFFPTEITSKAYALPSELMRKSLNGWALSLDNLPASNPMAAHAAPSDDVRVDMKYTLDENSSRTATKTLHMDKGTGTVRYRTWRRFSDPCGRQCVSIQFDLSANNWNTGLKSGTNHYYPVGTGAGQVSNPCISAFSFRNLVWAEMGIPYPQGRRSVANF